jgi:hypothetical protein
VESWGHAPSGYARRDQFKDIASSVWKSRWTSFVHAPSGALLLTAAAPGFANEVVRRPPLGIKMVPPPGLEPGHAF